MTTNFIAWAVLLLIMLSVLSWIDLRSLRLPDTLTIPLIALGLVQRWARGENLMEGIIGALAGYLSFLIIEVTYKHLRGRDGLGRGDAKLLGAGGAWCGWQGLPNIVLLASTSALLLILIYQGFRRRKSVGVFAFGPYLAFGIYAYWFTAGLTVGD